MILRGNNILVTGVANDKSIAWSIAKIAQQEGATVSFVVQNETFAEKVELLITDKWLHSTPALYICDFTKPEEIAELFNPKKHPKYSGIVHSIASAPKSCLSGSILSATAEDRHLAMDVSADSLIEMARAFKNCAYEHASIVGLTFEPDRYVPNYNYMGVCKAALDRIKVELAVELGPLGIRCNLVSAGPLNTLAARGITNAKNIGEKYRQLAPLGWSFDWESKIAVANAVCFLLSDNSAAITGVTLPVDGGAHCVVYRDV